MKKVLVGTWLAVACLSSMPAWSFGFSSCDGGSQEPKPEWVSKLDYTLTGYYVGVGSAERKGRTKEEQVQASESDAKRHLAQTIEVTIRAEDQQSTRVTRQGVQQDALSKVSVSAEEVLRDLRVKGRWVDKETCVHYTLLAVNNESVAQAKREKLMKNRLEKVKSGLAEGSDRDKNRDINVRRKYLEDAQALLKETDFSLLPEELKKEIYAKRLDDALAQLNAESAQVKGRVALFAISQNKALRPDVLGKMLDQIRTTDNATDRLMADCTQAEDCISRAKERGFTLLALLKVDTKVETSPMGALKATVAVSRTVYDIESRKLIKGPDIASAQVIGWSNDELDWDAASMKAVQALK